MGEFLSYEGRLSCSLVYKAVISCFSGEVDDVGLLRSTHHISTVWQGERPVL